MQVLTRTDFPQPTPVWRQTASVTELRLQIGHARYADRTFAERRHPVREMDVDPFQHRLLQTAIAMRLEAPVTQRPQVRVGALE